MKIRTLLAALGAAAALISMPAQAYLYSAIYAFGDSLSDNGQSKTANVLISSGCAGATLSGG